MAQNSAAIFMTLLIITLMPFAYMALFVADKQFFREDPAQSLYRSFMYYLSIVGVNAIVSTINGVIIMLLVYAMLGESAQSFTGIRSITHSYWIAAGMPGWHAKSRCIRDNTRQRTRMRVMKSCAVQVCMRPSKLSPSPQCWQRCIASSLCKSWSAQQSKCPTAW